MRPDFKLKSSIPEVNARCAKRIRLRMPILVTHVDGARKRGIWTSRYMDLDQASRVREISMDCGGFAK